MNAVPATMEHPLTRVRDVLALGKPRLSALVIFTAGAGLWLAPGQLGTIRSAMTLLGASMLVWAANAINCYIERHSDALMRRTRQRPLPSGRVEPRVALWAGSLVAATSLPMLVVFANPLAGLLGSTAFVVYVAIYTPMKRTSTWALPVGAIPGAVPPLMGWAAVTGSLEAGGWVLFGIMFMWQLPHFLAVSYYLRDDYARGGHQVFSIVHGEEVTRKSIILSILALIPVSVLPLAVGMAGWLYAACAVLLGVLFLARSLARGTGTRWARGVFLASLAYLTGLMGVLMVPYL